MSSNDRFLAAIVAGVLVLVVVAFAAARLRPEPEYRSDDSPEAAAHNYLLALQREDWERAQALLSPSLPCYPESPEVLLDDLSEGNRWLRDFDNLELQVESSSVEGDVALVTVRETRFWTGGLFDSGQSSRDFEMKLVREAGTWRLAQSDSYWWWMWSDPPPEGCRRDGVVDPRPIQP